MPRAPTSFPAPTLKLDRFHLKRSLTRALGFCSEATCLFDLARKGKAEEVIQGLEGHLKKTADEGKRKRISEAIAYISSLSAWLSDWREVLAAGGDDRSPGAICGQRGGARC